MKTLLTIINIILIIIVGYFAYISRAEMIQWEFALLTFLFILGTAE